MRRDDVRTIGRARIGFVGAAIVAGALLAGPPTVAATAGDGDPPPPDLDSSADGLVVIDARIDGGGPWTAMLGGRPHRELVFTVVNAGSASVDDPQVHLVTGRGADPATPLPSPDIGRLEPGGRVTVRVDLALPAFAVGTYAVEGTFDGSDVLGTFRAETSHVPWVLVLAPLLVLGQLSLVAVRNLVRRRIFGPRVTGREPDPDPDPPIGADLSAVIVEELDAVFDRALADDHGHLDDAALAALVVELSGRAAGQVAHRVRLTRCERAALDAELTERMLAVFALDPPDARSGQVAGSRSR